VALEHSTQMELWAVQQIPALTRTLIPPQAGQTSVRVTSTTSRGVVVASRNGDRHAGAECPERERDCHVFVASGPPVISMQQKTSSGKICAYNGSR
jgi:hypothetical protein